MKKGKNQIGQALLEGLLELIITFLFFGVGYFILILFDIELDSENLDFDLITLLGIVIFFAIFALLYNAVKLIKNKRSPKDKEEKHNEEKSDTDLD